MRLKCIQTIPKNHFIRFMNGGEIYKKNIFIYLQRERSKLLNQMMTFLSKENFHGKFCVFLSVGSFAIHSLRKHITHS